MIMIAKMFPKKMDKLSFGFTFWDKINVIKATIMENNNSNIYVFGFLTKYDWSKIFSITFAWTSTPGIVTPSGVLTKSNNPWADAPIKTYLSLKKSVWNLPS